MRRIAATFAIVLTVSCAGPDPSHVPVGRSTASRVDGHEDSPLARRWEAGIEFEKETFPEVQRLIERCMEARGFQYEPIPPATEYATAVASELSDRDYRIAFGYGISTAAGNRLLLEPLGPPDPNVEIRSQMSQRELASYDRALWGDGTRGRTVRFRDYRATIYPRSCTTRAKTAVSGSQAAAARASLRLNAALGPLHSTMEDDPRIRAALSRWSQCMRRGGFDLDALDQARDLVQRKLSSGTGPQARFEVRLYELRLARADARCQDGRFDAATSRVRRHHEGAFLERFGEVLDLVLPTR